MLDVPTTVANWVIYAPKEIKLLRTSGNLEQGAAAINFLEEPLMQVAAAAESPVASAYLAGAAGDKDGREAGFSVGFFNARRAKQGDRSMPLSTVSSKDGEFGMSRSVSNENIPAGQDLYDAVGKLASLQEAGILPLKIRLPKSGAIYRFNRLMTTQEALTLEATFVHLRMPWIVFGGVGLLLLPVGGFVTSRIRRS